MENYDPKFNKESGKSWETVQIEAKHETSLSGSIIKLLQLLHATYFYCILQSIKSIMKSWRVLLLEHVTSYVMDSVVDLENFLQEAAEGLIWRLGDNDPGDPGVNSREALLRMMGHLAEVRSRQFGTDELFTPLQEVNYILNTNV